MRIEAIDPFPDHAAIQRVLSPPITPVRRVPAVGQAAGGEEPTKPAAGPPDSAVTLDLSPEGREAARRAMEDGGGKEDKERGEPGEGGRREVADEERALERRVQELAERDRKVRTHEQAVRAIAGTCGVRGTTYSYQVGPDGRLYVVDGQVSLDTSEVPGDPEATLRKAEQLQQAALSGGEASPQERAAAAVAAALAAQARQKLARR